MSRLGPWRTCDIHGNKPCYEELQSLFLRALLEASSGNIGGFRSGIYLNSCNRGTRIFANLSSLLSLFPSLAVQNGVFVQTLMNKDHASGLGVGALSASLEQSPSNCKLPARPSTCLVIHDCETWNPDAILQKLTRLNSIYCLLTS